MDAIVIKNLRKQYGKLKAVNNISFNIKKGDFFGFIGPNGAGKTTTIKSIMGLLKYQGSIAVFDYDVVKEYKQARSKIGLSPQEYNLDNFLTVEEVLMYTAGYFGMKKEDARKSTEELLQQFKLKNKAKKRTPTLSGGMKRRLLIARALVHHPEILVLDEPTAGVDVQLRRELWDQLTEINKKGTTIILTSHYIEEVEKLCKTIGIINKGKIIALDKKEKIMENLSNQTLHIKVNKEVPEKVLLMKGCIVTQQDHMISITGKKIKEKKKEVIAKLKKANIKILDMEASEESLENIFLRITEEEEHE